MRPSSLSPEAAPFRNTVRARDIALEIVVGDKIGIFGKFGDCIFPTDEVRHYLREFGGTYKTGGIGLEPFDRLVLHADATRASLATSSMGCVMLIGICELPIAGSPVSSSALGNHLHGPHLFRNIHAFCGIHATTENMHLLTPAAETSTASSVDFKEYFMPGAKTSKLSSV